MKKTTKPIIFRILAPREINTARIEKHSIINYSAYFYVLIIEAGVGREKHGTLAERSRH